MGATVAIGSGDEITGTASNVTSGNGASVTAGSDVCSATVTPLSLSPFLLPIANTAAIAISMRIVKDMDTTAAIFTLSFFFLSSSNP